MVTRVLITDGEQRAALALVRSLGAADFALIVASHAQHPLAGASRYCAEIVRTPDPLVDTRAFAESVVRICLEMRIDVLIPTSEASLLAVLPVREQLHGVTVPFADASAFTSISDKQQVLRTAVDLGINVPRQIVLSGPDDIGRIDAAGTRYPLVIKPTRSVGGTNERREKHTVTYANSASELQRMLRLLSASAFPVLVQERVVGPALGVFLLIWEGRVLAAFSHRRLREKPPSGGVSVYAESIPADPSLVEHSRRLLAAFGWQGVAMIEYKIERDTGTAYLMEINGRFWGSLQLAIDAGVDFPALLLRAATNQRVEPPPQYRMGVRTRWWWGDVDHLLARLRYSDRDLALAEDAPSKLDAVLRFLVLWRRGDRNEVFRWNDPAPFVRESIDWFARL